MRKFFNDLKNSIKDLIIYEYKYLMVLFLITIVCYIPLNYYIVIGGGIDDISSRIKVEKGYKSEGSLNLSYVSTTDGILLTYLMSYVIPGWSRNSVEDYKYEETDNEEDINYRNDIALEKAIEDAKYVAYKKANKKIEVLSTNYYIISVMDGCNLKVADEILEIDGNKIDGFDYASYIDSLNIGDTVKVKVIRDKKEKVIDTTIKEQDGRKLMGIYLQKLEKYKTTPEVNIKFKRSESGPSGGLLTALSIYDQLTKEDITNGLVIAGTGTIDSEGNIGEIGGVEHKLRGAVAGKADVFLVPAGNNYQEAIKLAKKEKMDIEIVEATTFDNVIEKLKEIK